MVDTELLEKAIYQSGKRKGYLAKKCGLSLNSFRSRCINKYDFKSSEIDVLCEELDIRSLEHKEKIFFKKLTKCQHA